MIINALSALITSAGGLWLIAVVAALIASAAEASNAAPKNEIKLGPLGVIAGFLSLLTPFLLIIHGYWSVTLKRHPVSLDADLMTLAIVTLDNIVLTAILALFFVLTILPLLPGLIVRKTAPAFGTTLYKASPILHIVAFAIAAFATTQSVLTVAIALITGSPPAADAP